MAAAQRIATPTRYRLASGTVWFMLSVAAFFDFLQIITKFIYVLPVIGGMFAYGVSIGATVLAQLTFLLWFRIEGVTSDELLSSRLFLFSLFNLLVEAVPIINGLWPGWILLVLFTKRLVRQHDEQYNEQMQTSAARQIQQQTQQVARRQQRRRQRQQRAARQSDTTS